MSVIKGETVTYTDALGQDHIATVVHVWPEGPSRVNLVYTSGGLEYADSSVPLKAPDTTTRGRFWRKDGF